jgi:hypothetical protein
VIITRYEPPAGHSPGGLRYVLKEGHDQHAYMADLVGLAVKGLLIIETEDTSSGVRWSLARTDTPLPVDLSNAERTLMTTLFGSDTRIELKPRDSETATLMQASIRAHGAVIRKQYRGDYIVLNSKVLWVGLLSSIAVVISAFVLAAGHGLPAIVVGAIVLVLINIVFFRIMPAPTDRGRELRDEIEGLQRYLEIAEKDDIARLKAPDSKEPRLNAERFERLLPYAMALQVEDAWTNKFVAVVGAAAAAEASRRVSWYSGSGAATGSLSAMGSSLSKGLSSSISSSATPPGGSSGGGGGGFSGGGGGGGGGGGR